MKSLTLKPPKIPNSEFISKSYVKVRNLHADDSSLEKDTGLIKRKYKIVIKVIDTLNQFFFIVVTSQKYAFNPLSCVKITSAEWISIRKAYKPNLTLDTYADIKNIEVLDCDDIATKIADTNNGFYIAAEISKKKFDEIIALKDNIPRMSSKLSTTKLLIMNAALEISDSVSESIITKLGI